jgi:hypothetical protein
MLAITATINGAGLGKDVLLAERAVGFVSLEPKYTRGVLGEVPGLRTHIRQSWPSGAPKPRVWVRSRDRSAGDVPSAPPKRSLRASRARLRPLEVRTVRRAEIGRSRFSLTRKGGGWNPTGLSATFVLGA